MAAMTNWRLYGNRNGVRPRRVARLPFFYSRAVVGAAVDCLLAVVLLVIVWLRFR
jgi:hypothetical protein